MKKKAVGVLFWLSALCVPIFFLWSPNWLTLHGVSPSWAVLWLLPWVLDKGKFYGLLTGLCLGILLDALSISGVTQIPALMLLGFWWSSNETQRPPFELSLNLGLLAFLGTIICSFSLWLQLSLGKSFLLSPWFNGWAFHTVIAQSILTGLLAPMICSWILLIRRTAK